MNTYLKNLFFENLIKESHSEDEEEIALLRTVLEKQYPSILYGQFSQSEQEGDND